MPESVDKGSRPSAYEDLVAECIERLDDGGTAAVEDVLRHHPRDAEKIRSALERLQRSGLMDEEREFPDRLGDFRLLERIGGGGMGVVFLARQESLDRDVALKLVRPDFMFFDNARRRFRREVQAVSRLKHPGIVPVWHVGEERGVPFFAMEYVHGCSLGQVLDRVRAIRRTKHGESGGKSRSKSSIKFERRGQTIRDAIVGSDPRSGSSGDNTGARVFAGSWEQACLRITLRVAEAMVHAHEQQIVHRDIKPSNVMATADGQIKLVDFGLAFLETEEKLTKTNSLLGSMNYMSPEQLTHSDVDARADVYSLGATMYEMLSLETPFGEGTASTLSDRILKGDLPPLRKVSPGVSRDTETICETAMAVRAEHRYASMQAFADDLRNLLDLHPILARPPSVFRRATRWVQRNAVLSMAMMLMAVLAGSFSFLWWQQRQANHLLRQEQKRANTNLTAAIEANEKLEAERLRSVANFEKSRKAIDQMLARVANRNLAGVPYLSHIRQHLMQDALRLYKELSENNHRTEEAELDLFAVEVSVAKRHSAFGEMKQAEELVRSALTRIAALEAKNPSAALTFHRENANTHLADLCLKTGRMKEAESLLRGAVQAMEACLDGVIDRPELLDTLARSYHKLDTVYRNKVVERPSEPEWQRNFSELALELRERIFENHKDSTKARNQLAREYRRRGTREVNAKKNGEALKAIDQALKLFGESDVEVLPADVIYNLASCHGARAAVFSRMKRPGDSLAAREKEIALRKQLVDQDGSRPEYHGMLGAAYNNAAIVHLGQKRYGAAETLLMSAVRHQEKAFRMVPKHPDFRVYLRNHTYVLCRVYTGWKRPEELAETAALLATRDPRPPRGNFEAATFLCFALSLHARSAEHGSGLRRTWVRKQRDAVFARLGSAVESGYAAEKLLGGRQFAPVRDDPRFHTLRERAKAIAAR